jgi:hypothetical protein
MQMKLLGIISVDFDVIDQLLSRYLHSSDAGKNGAVCQFIDIKKAYALVREV